MAFITALAAGATVAAGVRLVSKRINKPPLSLAASLARPARPHTPVPLVPLPGNALMMRLKKVGTHLRDSLITAASDGDMESVEGWSYTHFAIATASLALSAGAVFIPALAVSGLFGLIFITIPLAQRAWRSLVQERQVTMPLIWTLSLPIAVVSGHLLAAAFGYWVAYLSMSIAANAKGETLDSMTNIFGDRPNSVWVRRDGYEIEVPLDSVTHDDIVIVYAGEMIPVDGVVVEGMAGVDQRMLTGESQPAEKSVGDSVFAATILISGRIGIQVQKTGGETVAAQIGQILNNTTSYVTDVELRGIELADRTALPNLALSALALPFAGGAGVLAVLLLPLGDALYIGGPLGVLNYLTKATRQGLLVKDGRAIELLQNVDTVVFDKTGTLTEEQPSVHTIHAWGSYSADALLAFAAAVEQKQSHPIARAILQAAEEADIHLAPVEESQVQMGYGLEMMVDGRRIRVGSAAFMTKEGLAIPSDIQQLQDTAHGRGHSLVFVAVDQNLSGAVELRATIRPEAQSIIDELHRRGHTIVILSGDQKEPTRILAESLGIDRYFAETRPEQKAEVIAQLQSEGRSVCFVGDGINDAIALKTAHVSVSLSGASTIATDTAQVVLMDGNLGQLIHLFDLSAGLDNNLRRTFAAGAVTSAAIIGGVFLFQISIAGAVLLNAMGMAASFGNAMLPALRPPTAPPSASIFSKSDK